MPKSLSRLLCFLALAACLPASPAAAQNLASLSGEEIEGTAFDGDWLSFGVGAGVGPSYEGSDDYTFFPVPLIQGRLGGIGINPRPAGLALNFLPADAPQGLSFGPSVRYRGSRSGNPKDEVVSLLPKLDAAIEVGPAVGFSFDKILHGYDNLSFSLDVRWDVAGAHKGMVINPSATYFTPLSKGAAVSLTIDADNGDDKFADYYFTVSPADAAITGMSQFAAKGGWTRFGGFLIGGVDFNGDLTDGGLALFGIVSYSRMIGDAGASPFTSERGNPDQFIGSIGLGYTF